jgi:hypothetical protein
MSQHVDGDQTIVEILAEGGRPVSEEGLERARRKLADAEGRRDHAARAALIERLRNNAA